MKLGDRMKDYESVSRTKIMRRTPAIIRIDGKAFHTWTKSLNRPFDDNMMLWMAGTTKYLVDNIQNAVFAYCQSDEISILLRDYDNLNTEQWFKGNIQKMCSVSASLATGYFNDLVNSVDDMPTMPLAFFDSRVYSIPKEEVTNYFIWRQQDCIRNSVQALANNVLGHKACQGLNCDVLKDKMLQDANVNWDNLPLHFKHGITHDKRSTNVQFKIPEFTMLREYVDVHVNNI